MMSLWQHVTVTCRRHFADMSARHDMSCLSEALGDTTRHRHFQLRMKSILNTNNSAKNTNSLPADQIRGVLDNLLKSKQAILDLVPADGDMRVKLQSKFDAPLL